MPSRANPSRSNALRDLIISAIWIVVSVLFLNEDRTRIASLPTGSHIPIMRWIQIPIWIAMLAFWIRNGWRSLKSFRANHSGSR